LPADQSGQSIGGGPNTPPPSIPPGQSGGDQTPPPDSAKANSSVDDKTAAELRQIRHGERWLIGVGAAAVVMNIVIGFIYYGQLAQMRTATETSTKAEYLSRDALDYSAAQFDRQMRKMIDQNVTAYASGKTTQDAMKLDERAWVSIVSAKLIRPYSLTSKGFVKITVANTGKTPALKVKIESAGFSDKENGVILVPTVAAESVAPPGSKENTVALAIGPGIPTDTKLFIRFILTYRDVLQQPREPSRVTTFCGFYPPDDSAEDRTTLMACPNGGNSMN
jgi:hypothetical protein